MSKQFSAACERNSVPIFQAIEPLLASHNTVLEIGSGTGQHSVYFSRHLPHIQWQCSDRLVNHASILAWIKESELGNVIAPIELDVAKSAWSQSKYDAVFTANTCHIMAWNEVVLLFEGVAKVLNPNGLFLIYGPFNYDGKFTSTSNQNFDHSLKMQASHMGIRDIEAIQQLAHQCSMQLINDITMPANNRLLALKNQINK